MICSCCLPAGLRVAQPCRYCFYLMVKNGFFALQGRHSAPSYQISPFWRLKKCGPTAAQIVKNHNFWYKFAPMEKLWGADKVTNPLHFGSNPADIRIWIRINPEIWIRNQHFNRKWIWIRKSNPRLLLVEVLKFYALWRFTLPEHSLVLVGLQVAFCQLDIKGTWWWRWWWQSLSDITIREGRNTCDYQFHKVPVCACFNLGTRH